MELKRIIWIFILSDVLIIGGAIFKVLHYPIGNWTLGVGVVGFLISAALILRFVANKKKSE